MSEKPSETQAMVMLLGAVRGSDSAPGHARAERLVPCAFAGILLPLVHLLLELSCFLLVHERETSQAFFEFKGVEECTILVVLEGVINLLVPDHSAVGRLKLY